MEISVKNSIPLILFLFVLFSYNQSYSQLLEKVKDGVESGAVTNPEQQLSQLKPTDNEYLDSKVYLMNRRFKSFDIKRAKKHAYEGYKNSPEDSQYEYIFYDRLYKNKVFVEAGKTTSNIYDSTNLYAEYIRNYRERDNVSVFIETQNRQYKTGSTNPTNAVTLGLGHTLTLDAESYLQTYISLGTVQNTFLPNYSIYNELYYVPGNHTFSLSLKYSSFNNSSATFVSPHYRYDFDPLYMGVRAYLTLAEITPGYAGKIYMGYQSIKWRAEVAYTGGTTIEDNVLNQKVNFSQYDLSLNYRFNLITEMGLRYSDYTSDILKQKGYFLNFLFKF